MQTTTIRSLCRGANRRWQTLDSLLNYSLAKFHRCRLDYWLGQGPIGPTSILYGWVSSPPQDAVKFRPRIPSVQDLTTNRWSHTCCLPKGDPRQDNWSPVTDTPSLGLYSYWPRSNKPPTANRLRHPNAHIPRKPLTLSDGPRPLTSIDA